MPNPKVAAISQKPISIATIAPPEILFAEICQNDNTVAAIKLAKPQRILTIGFDFWANGLRAIVFDTPQIKWGIPLARNPPIKKYQI